MTHTTDEQEYVPVTYRELFVEMIQITVAEYRLHFRDLVNRRNRDGEWENRREQTVYHIRNFALIGWAIMLVGLLAAVAMALTGTFQNNSFVITAWAIFCFVGFLIVVTATEIDPDEI